MIAKIYFLLNLFVLIAAFVQGPQAWSRRKRPVAKPLFLWCIFLILISSTHIVFFLVDYDFDAILIEKITISLGFFVQILWIWSLTEFTLDRVLNKWSFLLTEAVIMTVIIWTNSNHELFYSAVEVTTVNGLPNVVMSFEILRNIHAIFVTLLWNGFIIWAIIQHNRKPRVSSRVFYTLIFLVIVSQVQLWFYVKGITPFKFSIIINALIMLAATFYYRVLDIIPYARKKIVEKMEEGIAIINKKDEIIDRNSNFEKLMQVEVPISEPFLKISDLPASFQNVFSKEGRSRKKEIVQNINNKDLLFNFISINENQKEEGMFLMLRDITEQIQLNKQKDFYTQQLEVSKKELERLDQMKSNFFSNVTHEFRTPLTLIQEPARELIDYPDQKVRESARLISNNSNKLLELVTELLTLTRLDSGKVNLKMQIGDVTEVIRAEFQKFLPKAEKEGITLHLKVEKSFPPISFDRQKIESIVSNLLSNALKYTDHGSVVMTLNHVKTPQRQYIIKVKDTGRGIPEESLDKIFDRFYQVDSSNTRKGEGTGIGLALTQQMIHLMRGKITVESEMDQGSTFKVVLPIEENMANDTINIDTQVTEVESNVSVMDSNPSSEIKETLNNENLKIALVVEDNVELRQFIKSGLQSHYQTVTASNGEEGLQKAKNLLPDVIVSDVMMPEKDGITMLQELKADLLTSHIPIILLTAKSAVEDRLEGLSLGADEYLTKPFRMDELIIRSNNLINNRIRATQKYIAAYQARNPSQEAMDEPENDFMRNLILVIESELENESIQINDYAAKMYISRTHLHRKIKSLTNQSTTEFIRNYRLDKAMCMLRQKEGNVLEIASKVGFSSEKYFSTSFKKKFGVSPSHV